MRLLVIRQQWVAGCQRDESTFGKFRRILPVRFATEVDDDFEADLVLRGMQAEDRRGLFTCEYLDCVLSLQHSKR